MLFNYQSAMTSALTMWYFYITSLKLTFDSILMRYLKLNLGLLVKNINIGDFKSERVAFPIKKTLGNLKIIKKKIGRKKKHINAANDKTIHWVFGLVYNVNKDKNELSLVISRQKLYRCSTWLRKERQRGGVDRMHLFSGNCGLMTSIIYLAIMLLPMLVMDIN